MEFMSNVSSGLDEAKPSLFELISESQLRDLLEPSVRYVLAIVTQRHPRYLIHIFNRFDEVYALLMLLVERHYLRKWGGTFTENFYGIKRERMIARDLPRAGRAVPDILSGSTKLRGPDVWKSLFVIIGVPYLKRKLDDAYEIHSGGAATNLFGAAYRTGVEADEDASPRERLIFQLKRVLRGIYPAANAAYYLSALAFNLAYLFDKSKYHTPFHWMVKTRMRRLTEADHRAFEVASRSPRRPTQVSPASSPLPTAATLTQMVLPRVLDSLKILLPTSIFFLKFLEWWHASDFARQLAAKTAASIELPPPSAVPPPYKGQDESEGEYRDGQERQGRKLVALPKDSGTCPICLEGLTNPTALQTGYVFCYPCIFRWVQDGGDDPSRGYCPITGVKLLGGTDGLRRIMV